MLGPLEPDKGLAALPLPSWGDVFLDLESNPHVLDQGLEYVIGFLARAAEQGGEPRYESLWSFNRAEEACRRAIRLRNGMISLKMCSIQALGQACNVPIRCEPDLFSVWF